MEIEILDFIPDRKNARIGYADFTIRHSPEKEETFRQVAFFENYKNQQRWLSFGAVKRGEKYQPRYERKPPLDKIFEQVVPVLDSYINQRSALRNDIF